jgi:hypothetical protein
MNLEETKYNPIIEKARQRLKNIEDSKQKLIRDTAAELERVGMIPDMIAEAIVQGLRGYAEASYIRRCLDQKFKRKYRKLQKEENVLKPDIHHKNVLELLTDGSQKGSEDFDRMNRGPSITTKSKAMEKLNVSEDSDKMKRPGILPEPQRTEKLQQLLLSQSEEEKEMTKRENQILKKKAQPETLKELSEEFYDGPNIIDAKKLQKLSMDMGKDIEIRLYKHNAIVKDAVKADHPVPVGKYIMTKPEMMLFLLNIGRFQERSN